MSHLLEIHVLASPRLDDTCVDDVNALFVHGQSVCDGVDADGRRGRDDMAGLDHGGDQTPYVSDGVFLSTTIFYHGRHKNEIVSDHRHGLRPCPMDPWRARATAWKLGTDVELPVPCGTQTWARFLAQQIAGNFKKI